jgi:hypothetical protein
MHRPLEMKRFYIYRENVTIGGNENLYMVGPPWRTQDEPNDESNPMQPTAIRCNFSAKHQATLALWCSRSDEGAPGPGESESATCSERFAATHHILLHK